MKKEVKSREVPEYKVTLVKTLADKIKNSKTLLIASTKGLPSSQFHEIKKKFRGRADIRVAKKSIVVRAIDASKKPGIEDLKNQINADVALFFSDIDAFELSGLLADNQSSTKAKTGDIAPEDIKVEPGPTDLIPGPAISELSGVGLKVSVEGGKLAIKLPHTIVKAGDKIKDNVAGVLGKLNILPMKVGFEPLAAYDGNASKVYVGIKIDKKSVYAELKDDIKRAMGFAIGVKHISKETVPFFIGRAGMEEKAMEGLVNKGVQNA